MFVIYYQRESVLVDKRTRIYYLDIANDKISRLHAALCMGRTTTLRNVDG